MKIIEIKAQLFFELLKKNDTSMWEIFAQLLTTEPQLLVFLSEDNRVLFEYELPTTKEELEKQRKIFSQSFTQKIIHCHGK